jgi:hypothetical protein
MQDLSGLGQKAPLLFVLPPGHPNVSPSNQKKAADFGSPFLMSRRFSNIKLGAVEFVPSRASSSYE